ncbi:unnamed protein product [Closterium sp. NIES-64]|nr:unnamed protein product [Closterium sp. NIES-64]
MGGVRLTSWKLPRGACEKEVKGGKLMGLAQGTRLALVMVGRGTANKLDIAKVRVSDGWGQVEMWISPRSAPASPTPTAAPRSSPGNSALFPATAARQRLQAKLGGAAGCPVAVFEGGRAEGGGGPPPLRFNFNVPIPVAIRQVCMVQPAAFITLLQSAYPAGHSATGHSASHRALTTFSPPHLPHSRHPPPLSLDHLTATSLVPLLGCPTGLSLCPPFLLGVHGAASSIHLRWPLLPLSLPPRLHRHHCHSLWHQSRPLWHWKPPHNAAVGVVSDCFSTPSPLPTFPLPPFPFPPFPSPPIPSPSLPSLHPFPLSIPSLSPSLHSLHPFPLSIPSLSPSLPSLHPFPLTHFPLPPFPLRLFPSPAFPLLSLWSMKVERRDREEARDFSVVLTSA